MIDIDFENPQTIIIHKMFFGTVDGVSFTINANWAGGDDCWEVESVEFNEEIEDIVEIESIIIGRFLEEMN